MMSYWLVVTTTRGTFVTPFQCEFERLAELLRSYGYLGVMSDIVSVTCMP